MYIKYFLLLLGTGAQCPPSYTLVGGRCFWFMNNVLRNFMDAADLCDFYGGSLAKVDDCNLLGEIAQFAEVNGEHTRDISSNWSIIEFYDTREAASY